MANCNTHYSKQSFKNVSFALNRYQNLSDEELSKKVELFGGALDSNAIVAAYRAGAFTEQWEPKLAASITDVSAKPTRQNLIKLKEGRDDDRLKNEFTKTFGAGQYNRLYNDFKRKITGLCLYDNLNGRLFEIDETDKESGLSRVNRNLLDYRVSLLNDILQFLGQPEVQYDFSLSRSEADSIISAAISMATDIIKSKLDTNSHISPNAIESYYILSHFNEFVDSLGIVKIKPVYQGTENWSSDMFTVEEAYVEQDHSFTSTEDADIAKYTNKTVKLLLDLFVCMGDYKYEKTPITWNGFQNVMAKFAMYVDPRFSDSDAVKAMFDKDLLNGSDNALYQQLMLFSNSELLTRHEKSIVKGIANQCFYGKDAELKQLFFQAFQDLMKTQQELITNVFNPETNSYNIQRMTLEEKALSAPKTLSAHYIKRAAERLSIKEQMDLFKGAHNIEVNKDKIIFHKGEQDVEIPYSFETYTPEPNRVVKRVVFGNDIKNAELLDNDYVNGILQDLFNIEFSDESINDISKSLRSSDLLINAFWQPICLSIIAADPKNKEYFTNKSNDQILNFGRYSSDINKMSDWVGAKYGRQSISYLVNADGNKIPGYQLKSSIGDINTMIYLIKHPEIEGFKKNSKVAGNVTNVFQDNPLVAGNNTGIVGTSLRGDVVNIKHKNNTQLLESELMHIQVISDFANRILGHKTIFLQPIVYSDKKRQFIVEFDLNDYSTGYRGVRYSDLFSSIMTQNKGQDVAENEIKRIRGSKTKLQVMNMIERYSVVIPEINLQSDYSYDELRNNLNLIDNYLSVRTIDQVRSELQEKGSVFEETIDVNKKASDKRLHINETVSRNLDTYVNDDSTLFSQRINRAKREFAKSIIDSGIKLNSVFDSSINNLKSNIDSRFVTLYGMVPMIIQAPDGTQLEATIGNVYDQNNKITLNPIFESFFYAHNILSNSFNDILFGGVEGVDSKFKGAYDPSSDDFYIANEASRTSALLKRTVIAGATRHSYMQNLSHGVPQKINIACIDDYKGHIENIAGMEDDGISAHNGAGFTNPIYARMANESLKAASVSNHLKKTIFNYTDPQTGQLREIKWAEYTITHQMRKGSLCGGFDMENLLKHLYNYNIWKDIRLSDFDINNFIGEGKGYSKYSDYRRKSIKYNGDLFYKNEENGNFYKLINISSFIDNGGLVLSPVWQECDIHGNLIAGSQPETQRREIRTLYDFDQALGGAFCMTLQDGILRDSDVNDDILYNIVCEHNLRDMMTAHAIQHEAIKVGFANGNSVARVMSQPTNDNQLATLEISSRYGGVQMDADKEIEESEISEMSQMMSSLIQDGISTSEANKVYIAVGKVVSDAMRKINLDDDLEVYKFLGKTLIDSFAVGEKSVMGLAQSFIKIAEEAFKNGDFSKRIPFSAQTIIGNFESVISAMLNTMGVRRKMSGVDATSNPSHDVFHVFKIKREALDENNNVKYEYDYGKYDDAIDVITSFKKANPEYSNIPTRDFMTKEVINGRLNPFTTKFNKRPDVRFEDTFIIAKPLPDGNVVTEKVKVDNFDSYEKVIAAFDTGIARVYRMDMAPRNLAASWTTFTYNGNTYSLLDLDETKGIFYANRLLKNPGDAITKQKFDKVTAKYSSEGIVDYNDWIKFLKRKQQRVLDRLANPNKAANIGNQSFMINGRKDVVNIKTDPTEIAMGRVNAKALGLDKSSLHSILTNPTYFVTKTRAQFDRANPTDKIMESELKKFDGMLIGKDGSKILISVTDDPNSIISKANLQKNTAYETGADGSIYRNGEEFCADNPSTKTFYKYWRTADGEPIDVIIVNSRDDINDLLNTNQFFAFKHFYNKQNIESFIKDVKRNKNIMDLMSPDAHDDDDLLLDELRQIDAFDILISRCEDQLLSDRISDIAEWRRQSFMKSLEYQISRIPSQNLQSTETCKVVAFSDEDTNDSYIPLSVMEIMGADLDIDSNHQMTFSYDQITGKLYCLSDLADKYGADKIMGLNVPTGEIFEQDDNGKKLSEIIENNWVLSHYRQNVETVLNAIIDSGVKNIDFTGHEDILRDLNTHNKSKRKGRALSEGLKNYVAQMVMNVSGSVNAIVKSTTAVSMKAEGGVSETSSLANKEKTMTLDNPGAIGMMQVQNMVGKDVIAIGASGMKAYYAAAFKFNHQILELADKFKNDSFKDPNTIAKNIWDNVRQMFIKSPIDDSYRLWANTNFEPLRSAIESAFSNNTIVPIDLRIANDMATFFGESITNNGQLDLLKLVDKLDEKSNGTWQNPINASDALSCIITMATDNAKELKLSKLNCDQNTAKIYISGVCLGYSIPDIASLMLDDSVSLAIRFGRTNVFNRNSMKANFGKALDFIKGESFMGLITKSKLFRIITKNSDLNNTKRDPFITYLTHETSIQNGQIVASANYRKSGDPIFIKLQKIFGVANQNDLRRLEGTLSNDFDSTSDNANKVIELMWDNNIVQLFELYVDKEFNKMQDPAKFFDPSLDPEEIVERYASQEDLGEYNEEDLEASDNQKLIEKQDYANLKLFINDYLRDRNNFAQSQINVDKIDKIKKLIEYADEVSLLANILSINQGIKTKDFDELHWIERIENFVWNKLGQEFDLLEFINTDEETRQTWIDKYDAKKSAVNILEVMVKTPNFWSMIQAAAKNRKLIERSAVLKMERSAAKIIRSRKLANNINKNVSNITAKEHSALKRVIRDAVAYSWLRGMNLKLSVPVGYKYFRNGNLIQNNNAERGAYEELSTNSLDGIATFKKCMEDIVIPMLKTEYKDNPFIKDLIYDSYYNPVTGEQAINLTLPMDIAAADNNADSAAIYDEYLRGFNSISNVKATGVYGIIADAQLTIGDLLYLYNLITYKDGFANGAMTRIFEDLNSTNGFSLVNAYNEFISKLDSGLFKTDSMSKNPNGMISFGDGESILVSFHINDFIARCAAFEDVYPQFKTSVEKQGKKIVNVDGKPINRDASYYTFNLQWTEDSSRGSHFMGIGDDVNPVRNYNVNSKEVSMSMIDYLRKITSKMHNGIHITDTAELKKLEIYESLRDASAWVQDGQIWINTENLSRGTHGIVKSAIHEVMHFVIAAMKFGEDNNLRKFYYQMLNQMRQTEEFVAKRNEIALGYDQIASINGDASTDIDEETIVHIISEYFAKRFTDGYAQVASETKETQQQMEKNVLAAMAYAFGLTENVDVNKIVETGSDNILDFFNAFNSVIVDLSDKSLQAYMLVSQKLNKLKTRLSVKTQAELDGRDGLFISDDCK